MTVKEFYIFCEKAGMENATINLSWGDRFELGCEETLLTSSHTYFNGNKVYIDAEPNCLEKMFKKYLTN